MTPEIRKLRKSLARAKSRALYWSGNPSFTGRRFRPGARRALGGPDEQYELAMCDVENLSRDLEALTGKAVKRYDPKQAFREKFNRMMSGVHTRNVRTPAAAG